MVSTRRSIGGDVAKPGDLASPPTSPRRDARGTGQLTKAQQTAARRKESKQLMLDRQNILIWRRPVSTTWLFGCTVVDAVRSATRWLLKNYLTTLLPTAVLLAVYLGAAAVDGPHTPLLVELEHSVLFAVWWIGLGVLSSIGLGTGMHSGMLFLFPHILKTVLFAETCGHLNFDSRINMWDKALTNSAEFVCLAPSGAPVRWFTLCAKLLPAGILWGAGTAAGEIPPYFVSYSAAKLGSKANDELDELKINNDVMTRMKRWMIDILKRFGFWAVLGFSAYPNAAFDLVGICCGHFMMPFWTFFSGTMIGKGFIKAPGQVAGAVAVFGSSTRSMLLRGVAAVLAPAHLEVFTQKLHEGIHKFQRIHDDGHSSHDDSKATVSGIGPAQVWNLFVVSLVGYFALSCIHQFAKFRQQELDEASMDATYPLTVSAKTPVKKAKKAL